MPDVNSVITGTPGEVTGAGVATTFAPPPPPHAVSANASAATTLQFPHTTRIGITSLQRMR
jgi:hypothetical protein